MCDGCVFGNKIQNRSVAHFSAGHEQKISKLLTLSQTQKLLSIFFKKCSKRDRIMHLNNFFGLAFLFSVTTEASIIAVDNGYYSRITVVLNEALPLRMCHRALDNLQVSPKSNFKFYQGSCFGVNWLI